MPALNDMPDQQPVAEVISASITELTAECWNAGTAPQGVLAQRATAAVLPRFGSFVRVDSVDTGIEHFAVVFNALTGAPDRAHRPLALGMTREQLKQEQPHIFSLLRTEVHATLVGYRQGGRLYQHLPPKPPEVHDFVYGALPADVEQLSEQFDFLRLLTKVSAVPADELIAACLREAAAVRKDSYNYLVRAGQALSHVVKQDYDRLVSVLRKIHPDCLG